MWREHIKHVARKTGKPLRQVMKEESKTWKLQTGGAKYKTWRKKRTKSKRQITKPREKVERDRLVNKIRKICNSGRSINEAMAIHGTTPKARRYITAWWKYACKKVNFPFENDLEKVRKQIFDDKVDTNYMVRFLSTKNDHLAFSTKISLTNELGSRGRSQARFGFVSFDSSNREKHVLSIRGWHAKNADISHMYGFFKLDEIDNELIHVNDKLKTERHHKQGYITEWGEQNIGEMTVYRALVLLYPTEWQKVWNVREVSVTDESTVIPANSKITKWIPKVPQHSVGPTISHEAVVISDAKKIPAVQIVTEDIDLMVLYLRMLTGTHFKSGLRHIKLDHTRTAVKFAFQLQSEIPKWLYNTIPPQTTKIGCTKSCDLD